jgi:hypothetical protein
MNLTKWWIKKYNLKFNYIRYIVMDVNKLLEVLDDESNDNLFNFTSDKLREMNT